MSDSYIFTSESVGGGHPDKLADYISDSILDAILEQDPRGRVACETLVKTGLVLLAGEITTTAKVDYQDVARQAVKEIGYTDPAYGFSADHVAILAAIDKQSPDIAQGVDKASDTEDLDQGAGDQGLMFGYACRETDALMPLPIQLSHRLTKRHSELFHNGKLPWLRPDAKSQVSVRYEKDRPVGIDTVVLSTQHDPDIGHEELKQAVIEEIIKPELPEAFRSDNIKYLVNPTGRFVIGGPVGDCGLTGRKIIVDTYGGAGHHGGGAFSGKDPSKVDRSAAYAARYVAKNIVAAGLAEKCEVQLSYAIGVARPVSVNVRTYGTGKIPELQIENLVRETFDLRPRGIVQMLDLLRPIYKPTAAYGHFGRDEASFTWEKTDKAEALRSSVSAAA